MDQSCRLCLMSNDVLRYMINNYLYYDEATYLATTCIFLNKVIKYSSPRDRVSGISDVHIWRKSFPLARYAHLCDIKIENEEEGKALAPLLRGLIYLRLNKCSIKGNWFSCLQGIRELYLGLTNLVDPQICKYLDGIHTLTIDRLSDNDLVYLKGIHTLDLGYSNITEKGLEHLKGIHKLAFMPRDLSPTLLKPLTGIPQLKLQSLDQKWPANDDVFEYIHGIEDLWLFGTNITDSAFVHLKGIKYLTLIDIFRINGSGFHHLSGIRRLRLIRFKTILSPGSFKSLSSLMSLDLSGHGTRPLPIVESDFEYLINLRHLYIRNSQKFELRWLGYLKNLEFIDVVRCKQITVEIFSLLPNLKKIYMSKSLYNDFYRYRKSNKLIQKDLIVSVSENSSPWFDFIPSDIEYPLHRSYCGPPYLESF